MSCCVSSKDNCKTPVIIVGIIAAIATAGIVGLLVDQVRRPLSPQQKNVSDIIAEAQSTIREMDNVLNRLTS